ncbi:MAG: hypothetical protein JNJ83_19045 [Verrucomicrobiaceae bacterium]|nr:hypothetical protein [Verrucomicrobiaceae bacterium]
MNLTDIIAELETQWDIDGFLYELRTGRFDAERGRKFMELLRSISVDDEESVPKRLLSLVWYLPSFLEWQKARIGEMDASHCKDYAKFVTEVHNTLEDVLGVP